ncbi:hypothetical protein MYCTH_2301802 [Thermothelomyces thermophilus ATCC 42464]|uniref:Uncharacterized protein n=1 Tax=Thermothelomyces thermophilus (strain ATCC 42464 / BCRC 31852 / DSM 1799) TaxID=573729 RepID=G2QAA4_THET4|nr:uncharacterized protein MYCTH_2301802 [Thermothelomyces thermophilus ATCC 42464]AEO56654.1 hypothetical protein MYCTH_2301802 [Thermothelomyces thermophilus ATCC 42464]
MPRYGFSSRWADSPFSSQDGVPDVTSEDYSYITSLEIEDHGLDIPRPYAGSSHVDDPYSHSAPSPTYASLQRPEDDILLLTHQGVTYPEHFPAYSIGDGKLLVSDLRERVRIILDLSERQAKRVKFYYKGRRLKKGDMPVCDYGVKNNSEILLVLGEPNRGSGSETSEEVVVVGQDERNRYKVPQSNSPRIGRSSGWEDHSQRVGGSQAGLEVPVDDGRRRASSRVRTRSPGPAVSTPSASDTGPVCRPGGPTEKLNALAAEFDTTWLPQCVEFIERTPVDPKKRDEEHRKLSEMVLQKIIMKADEIEATSEEGARAVRRALLTKVLGILSKLDQAKASA